MQSFFVSIGLTRAGITPVILTSFLVLALFTFAFIGSRKAQRTPPDYGLPRRGKIYFAVIYAAAATLIVSSFVLIHLPPR